MKKTMLIMAVLMIALVPMLLMADNGDTVIKDGQKKIIIKSTSNLSDLEELKKMNIDVNMLMQNEGSPDSPFFGIYPAEMDFPKAQALNYNYNYGILITGIVPNSPAYEYRLAEDDILMEIGGKKVLNLKELDKLKSYYRAGDAVNLTVFRAGEIKSMDFVFGSNATKKVSLSGENVTTKKRLSTGFGGGTWVPMWFDVDMTDVNDLVQTIGFSALPEEGVLTQGIAGKITVGKGWYVGGQFQFYNDSKKINEVIGPDYFTNTMDYNMFIGGATLDKRIPITKNIITSMGLMIGGATHSVDLVHSNGNYNWPTAGQTTQNILSHNSSASMSKGYILVQPRAEVMVRLLSWLGLRAEGGYIYGYGPTSGWKVNHNDTETYELKNSPNTKFQGYSITVGPWFGF